MPPKKKAGRARTFPLLLALCLLLGGCKTEFSAASGGAAPSEPVSEGTSAPEGSGMDLSEPPDRSEQPDEASVPDVSAPEEHDSDPSEPPDPTEPDISDDPSEESTPEESLPEEITEIIVPEAPVPAVEAPVPYPSPVETDDPETLSLLAELSALAKAYGLSVSYLSGDGAYAFSVNGGEVRSSASTIKAMYCEYLLESGIDWQTEILFDVEELIYSNSGALTEEKLGSTFPVGELIDYALRYSDNMAYELLYVTFGKQNYNTWVRELGIPGLQIHSKNGYTNLSADDLSRGMLEIYRYSLEDGRVVSPLKRARFRNRITAGTPYATACKFGLKSDRTGYHETAIIYAPEPYVLTIMSALNPDNPGEAEPFIEVIKLTDRLNERLTQNGSGETS